MLTTNLNMEYSLKNIPTPMEFEYRKLLMQKSESIIRRMRWKAHFVQKKSAAQVKDTYGFNTRRSPPTNALLNPFETEFWEMIRNIKFKRKFNDIQTQNEKRH